MVALPKKFNDKKTERTVRLMDDIKNPPCQTSACEFYEAGKKKNCNFYEKWDMILKQCKYYTVGGKDVN